ncbi:MAG: sulfite exporter TauE/SafE family protein [Candidatus Omnitrophica bacterium]|nr:sulfite exporter TauE/SafE family protein [Candidatus Omnitrophota bacterium]
MGIIKLIEIFIVGVAMGNGACLFFCFPIIIPYLGGYLGFIEKRSNWKEGLTFILIFLFCRLFAYASLGLLSVVFYQFVLNFLGIKGIYLHLILGVLLIIIGLVYLFNPQKPSFFCKLFYKNLLKQSKFNMVLFGLLIGFSPCGPLLGVLSYISALSKNPLEGFLGGLFFGLGTLISLIIPIGVIFGFIIEKIKKSAVIISWIRRLSGLALFYFGLRLVLKFFR